LNTTKVDALMGKWKDIQVKHVVLGPPFTIVMRMMSITPLQAPLCRSVVTHTRMHMLAPARTAKDIRNTEADEYNADERAQTCTHSPRAPLIPSRKAVASL
jgi:hypothetical protein